MAWTDCQTPHGGYERQEGLIMCPMKYTIYMDNAIHGHHGNGKEVHVNQTLQSQNDKIPFSEEGVKRNGN